jgi:hypothetical protein
MSGLATRTTTSASGPQPLPGHASSADPHELGCFAGRRLRFGGPIELELQLSEVSQTHRHSLEIDSTARVGDVCAQTPERFLWSAIHPCQ